ncbi:hypothetical protein [Xenorhabdus bovienii]|uniref:hypothetical protein n=1 Tax=Xenorhabdus bovienii TaxID=40576 RepID=UPI00237C8DED|nr:hypothetical protein [Xenorhabdus bovienii]MDE1493109.1 hypothetical protein [Xenorhabdus bovienii]
MSEKITIRVDAVAKVHYSQELEILKTELDRMLEIESSNMRNYEIDRALEDIIHRNGFFREKAWVDEDSLEGIEFTALDE